MLGRYFWQVHFPVYECIVPSNRPMNEQSRTMNAWYPYHPMYIYYRSMNDKPCLQVFSWKGWPRSFPKGIHYFIHLLHSISIIFLRYIIFIFLCFTMLQSYFIVIPPDFFSIPLFSFSNLSQLIIFFSNKILIIVPIILIFLIFPDHTLLSPFLPSSYFSNNSPSNLSHQIYNHSLSQNIVNIQFVNTFFEWRSNLLSPVIYIPKDIKRSKKVKHLLPSHLSHSLIIVRIIHTKIKTWKR